jgi:hypothetical protein
MMGFPEKKKGREQRGSPLSSSSASSAHVSALRSSLRAQYTRQAKDGALHYLRVRTPALLEYGSRDGFPF